MRIPTRKMVSFAAEIIRGRGPTEALANSLYVTEHMTQGARSSMATQLLAHPQIASAIECARRDVLESAAMDRSALVESLEFAADTGIVDLIEFEEAPVYDRSGQPVCDREGRQRVTTTWRIRDDVDPRRLKAISEIRETDRGKPVIKLESKAAARAQLAKLHGWDAPPKAPVGQDGEAVAPVVVQITREVID